MKKIFFVLSFVFISVSLTGCTPSVSKTVQNYPWSIILVMQFELKYETVGQNAVSTLKELLDNENVIHEDNILQVGLVFDNFDEFANYFEIDANAFNTVSIEIKECLFFLERTINFNNPWQTVLDTALGKVNTIHLKVNNLFNLKNPSATPSFMYVFSSSFRRTEVKNTVNQEQIGRTFNYIFTYGDQNGTDEIVIFDRFANTPIWYGLAVLTSGIFIAGTYIIISRKRSGETPTPVQSTKNDL